MRTVKKCPSSADYTAVVVTFNSFCILRHSIYFSDSSLYNDLLITLSDNSLPTKIVENNMAAWTKGDNCGVDANSGVVFLGDSLFDTAKNTFTLVSCQSGISQFIVCIIARWETAPSNHSMLCFIGESYFRWAREKWLGYDKTRNPITVKCYFSTLWRLCSSLMPVMQLKCSMRYMDIFWCTMNRFVWTNQVANLPIPKQPGKWPPHTSTHRPVSQPAIHLISSKGDT